MNAEEQPSSPSPSQPPDQKPSRVEDILLERLKNEPKIHKQIATPILLTIVAGIIGLGIAVYFFSRRPEKFLVNAPQKEAPSAAADSSELLTKRQQFQPMIDSLNILIASNPNDSAHLVLGNVYNECEYWDKAKSEFEFYLGKHPKDVDARGQYAFTLAQGLDDFSDALKEVNLALKYAPDDANLLFNAGLLAIRAHIDDKPKALAEATGYFKLALAAAKKQGNDKMAEQIEQILTKVKEKPAEP